MFWTVIAIFEVLGLITAVHAIMSVRTPQGTIAWVAALVTIAPVSVPAYWVFGRNFAGGRAIDAAAHEMAHDAQAGLL